MSAISEDKTMEMGLLLDAEHNRNSPERIYITKLRFRIVTGVLCLILLGLNVISMKEWGRVGIVYFAPPVALSLLWGLVEGVSVYTRPGRRGINPGLTVTVDGILMICYHAAATTYGLKHGGWDQFYAETFPDYAYCMAQYVDNMILALSSLQIFFHVVMFVIGCFEITENKRKIARSYIDTTRGDFMNTGSYCRYSDQKSHVRARSVDSTYSDDDDCKSIASSINEKDL
ncbi:hypothetical protein V2G26_020971 [Clonostachys chloroleuca]|uniref:Uncharacterized protein n=1 Tax=Clonostachys chloroleuca TaxID=1926264 RepID=A0AA35Q321_9HYPO|nr:unnamed protein product [Clonostachys chloroleuca]